MHNTQQQEQKRAQMPGSLGREVAENEERGEQGYEGFNRPAAARREQGAAEPGLETYGGTEEAPTPHINVDPIRQNVAYVYPSADDAPGGGEDLGVVRSEPEPGMEGSGEAFVRHGPGVGMPGVHAMPKGSATGSGRGYDRGAAGYDTREGALRRGGPAGPEERVHLSGKSQPEGYMK